MKPNGTRPANGAELSGTEQNGSAEPTVGEILAFLRGTLTADREAAGPPIKVPERAPGEAPDTFAVALAKAEAMAAAAETARDVQAKETAPQEAAAPQSTPLMPVNMPFKDSRFMRLAAVAPLPEIIAEAHPVPPPEALASLASARKGQGADAGGPHWTAAAMAQAAPQGYSANSVAAATPLAVAVQPPPVPANVPAVIDAEFNTVESAAAELLRPMLRQWLANNMPRIVEKALRIELAEVPPDKRER